MNSIGGISHHTLQSVRNECLRCIGVCVCVGCGWGWMLLPTHLQQYFDPISLVSYAMVLNTSNTYRENQYQIYEWLHLEIAAQRQ